MSSAAPNPEALWNWALEDAGLSAADVDLIAVSSAAASMTRGRFMPPGDRDVPALSDDDRAAVREAADRTRVVLPVAHLASDPHALLALMRHHLEYARVLHENRAAYELSLDVAGALYPVYRDAGKGSALVYNLVPMMASANGAGARLVARRLGVPLDRLDDPDLGLLFRLPDVGLSREALPRRLVVFGAIWSRALAEWVGGEDRLKAGVLADVADDALMWWDALTHDETFAELADAAARFRPTAAERETFADRPATAWLLAKALIERAMLFGLTAVLQRAPLRQPR